MKNGSRRIDHPMVSPYHIARPTTMIDATAKSTKDSATEAAGNISLRTAIFFRRGPFNMMQVPARVTPPAKKVHGTIATAEKIAKDFPSLGLTRKEREAMKRRR